jgi:hypothetical protein
MSSLVATHDFTACSPRYCRLFTDSAARGQKLSAMNTTTDSRRCAASALERRVAMARDARRVLAGKKLAVALHDVEPATFDRCARIRDWLDDLGVDRMTLVVVPARGATPELTRWLAVRADRGDEVAQLGAPRRAGLSRALVRRVVGAARSTLRLDVHPADLDRPRHVLALERVLRAARGRTAATLGELSNEP